MAFCELVVDGVEEYVHFFEDGDGSRESGSVVAIFFDELSECRLFAVVRQDE